MQGGCEQFTQYELSHNFSEVDPMSHLPGISFLVGRPSLDDPPGLLTLWLGLWCRSCAPAPDPTTNWRLPRRPQAPQAQPGQPGIAAWVPEMTRSRPQKKLCRFSPPPPWRAAKLAMECFESVPRPMEKFWKKSWLNLQRNGKRKRWGGNLCDF